MVANGVKLSSFHLISSSCVMAYRNFFYSRTRFQPSSTMVSHTFLSQKGSQARHYPESPEASPVFYRLLPPLPASFPPPSHSNSMLLHYSPDHQIFSLHQHKELYIWHMHATYTERTLNPRPCTHSLCTLASSLGPLA